MGKNYTLQFKGDAPNQKAKQLIDSLHVDGAWKEFSVTRPDQSTERIYLKIVRTVPSNDWAQAIRKLL